MKWDQKRCRLPGILIFPLLAFAVHPAAAAPRPDAPDHAMPFLHTPVKTVAELVREVQADPAAQARYAQVFHLAPQSVPAYLQSHLVPGILPSSDTFTAYFVSQYGPIYPVWLSLPAGAHVFMTHDRVPMLLCSTGDPLRPTLKISPPKAVLTVSSTPPTPTTLPEGQH